MRFSFDLAGAAPILKKYPVNETMATAGVPVLVAPANGVGLALCSTTAAADAVGVTQDTAVYSATQGAAEGLVTVCINPFAVWAMPLSGGATAGTAMVLTRNSSASATGLTITITTGDPVPNNPEMDEGGVYCIAGDNVGFARKITSTTATTVVVIKPFPQDISTRDVFVVTPYPPMPDVAANNIQLTSNLAQADHTIVVGTGIAARLVEVQFDYQGVQSSSTAYRGNCDVLAILDDHIYNVTT